MALIASGRRGRISNTASAPTTFLDQAVSSITNLLPQIIALSLSASQFRNFTLAWGSILVVQSVARSSLAEYQLANRSPVMSTSRLQLGVAISGLVGVVLCTFGPATVVGVALLVPALCRFEVRRYALLAARPRSALALDCLWLLLLGPTTILAFAITKSSSVGLILGWLLFVVAVELVILVSGHHKARAPSCGCRDAALAATFIEHDKVWIHPTAGPLVVDAVVAQSIGYIHLAILAYALSVQGFATSRATLVLAGPLIFLGPVLTILTLKSGSCCSVESVDSGSHERRSCLVCCNGSAAPFGAQRSAADTRWYFIPFPRGVDMADCVYRSRATGGRTEDIPERGALSVSV